MLALLRQELLSALRCCRDAHWCDIVVQSYVWPVASDHAVSDMSPKRLVLAVINASWQSLMHHHVSMPT